MRYIDITYCGKCEKYFKGTARDYHNFPICPKCGDWHEIIQIQYEEDGSFVIEELDEMCLNFYDHKQCKKKLRIIQNLLNKSKK